MSALVPCARGEDGGIASSSGARVGDVKQYPAGALNRVNSYPQPQLQKQAQGNQSATLGRSSTQFLRPPSSVLRSGFVSVRTPLSRTDDVISAEANPCAASLLLLGRTIALPSSEESLSKKSRRPVVAEKKGSEPEGCIFKDEEASSSMCTTVVSSTTRNGAVPRSSFCGPSASSSAASSSGSAQLSSRHVTQLLATQDGLNGNTPTFSSLSASSSAVVLYRENHEEAPSRFPHSRSSTATSSSAKAKCGPCSSLLSSSVIDQSRSSSLPDFLSLSSSSAGSFPQHSLTSQYFVLDSVIQSTAGLSTPVKLPLDASSSICFEPSIRCALHPPPSPPVRVQASSPRLPHQPLCCTRSPSCSSSVQGPSPDALKETSSFPSFPGGHAKGSQTALAGSALKRVLGPHLLLPPAVVAVPLHAPIVLVDRVPVATPSTPSLFFPPSLPPRSPAASPHSLSSTEDGACTPRPSCVSSPYTSGPSQSFPAPEGCSFHPHSSEYPFRQGSASEFPSKGLHPSSSLDLSRNHRYHTGGFINRALRIDTSSTTEADPTTAVEPEIVQEEETKPTKDTLSTSSSGSLAASESRHVLYDGAASSVVSGRGFAPSSDEEEDGEGTGPGGEEDALLARIEEETVQCSSGPTLSPFAAALVFALRSALRQWVERATFVGQQQAYNDVTPRAQGGPLKLTMRMDSTKEGEADVNKTADKLCTDRGHEVGGDCTAEEEDLIKPEGSFLRSSVDPKGVHVCLVIPHIFLTYQSGKLTSISSLLEKGYQRRSLNRVRRQLNQQQHQHRQVSLGTAKQGGSCRVSSPSPPTATSQQPCQGTPSHVGNITSSTEGCLPTGSLSSSAMTNVEGDRTFRSPQGGARLLVNSFLKNQKDGALPRASKGSPAEEFFSSASLNDRLFKQIEEDVTWLPLAYHHQSQVEAAKTKDEKLKKEEGMSPKKEIVKTHAFKLVSSSHKKTTGGSGMDSIYPMVVDCHWASHGLLDGKDGGIIETDGEKHTALEKETDVLLSQKYVHGIVLASFLEVYVQPKVRRSTPIAPPWAPPPPAGLSGAYSDEGVASKGMVGSTNQTGRLTSSLSTLDESFEVFVVSGSFSPDELRGIQRRFRQSSSGISIADFVRLAIEITRTQFSRLGLLVVARPVEALFLSNRLRTTHFSTLFSEALVLYTTGHASLSLPLFHVAFRAAVEVLKNNRDSFPPRSNQAGGRGGFATLSALSKAEDEARPTLARWKTSSKRSEGQGADAEGNGTKIQLSDVRSGEGAARYASAADIKAGEEETNSLGEEKKESPLSLLHLIIAWRGSFNLWTREQKKALIERGHPERQVPRDFLGGAGELLRPQEEAMRERSQEEKALKKTVESCARLSCDVLDVVDILLEALLTPSSCSSISALNDDVLTMMASRRSGSGGLQLIAVVECLRGEAFDFLSELLWMFPSISIIGKDCRASILQHLSAFSPPAPSKSSSPSRRRSVGSRSRSSFHIPAVRQPPITYCTFGKIPSVESTCSGASSSAPSTRGSAITASQNDRSFSSPSSFEESALCSGRGASSFSNTPPLWMHVAACAFGLSGEQDRVPKGSVEALTWKHLAVGASGAFERAYQVAVKLDLSSEIRWDTVLSFSSFLLYTTQQASLAVVILRAHLHLYDCQFSSSSAVSLSSAGSTTPLTCSTRSSDEMSLDRPLKKEEETSSSFLPSTATTQDPGAWQVTGGHCGGTTSFSRTVSPTLACCLLVEQARRLHAVCSVHVMVLVFDLDTSVLLKPLAGASWPSSVRSSRSVAQGNPLFCLPPRPPHKRTENSPADNRSCGSSPSPGMHRSSSPSPAGMYAGERRKTQRFVEGRGGEGDGDNDSHSQDKRDALGRNEYGGRVNGRDRGPGVESFFSCSTSTREDAGGVSLPQSSRGGAPSSGGFNPFLIPFASCLAPGVGLGDSDDDYGEGTIPDSLQSFSHQAGCALDEGEIILETNPLSSSFSVSSAPYSVGDAVPAPAVPSCKPSGGKCPALSPRPDFPSASYLRGGQPHPARSFSTRDSERSRGLREGDSKKETGSFAHWGESPGAKRAASMLVRRAVPPPVDLFLSSSSLSPTSSGEDPSFTSSFVTPEGAEARDCVASNSLDDADCGETKGASFASGEEGRNRASDTSEKRLSSGPAAGGTALASGEEMPPHRTIASKGALPAVVNEETRLRNFERHSSVDEREHATAEKSWPGTQMNEEQGESVGLSSSSDKLEIREETSRQSLCKGVPSIKEKECSRQQKKSVSFSESQKEIRFMSTDEEEWKQERFASTQQSKIALVSPRGGCLDEEKLFLFELQKMHAWGLPRRLRWVSGGAVVSSSAVSPLVEKHQRNIGEARDQAGQSRGAEEVSSLLTACILATRDCKRWRSLKQKDEESSYNGERRAGALSPKRSYGARSPSVRLHNSSFPGDSVSMPSEPVAFLGRKDRTQLVCSPPVRGFFSRCACPVEAGELVAAAGAYAEAVSRDREQALQALKKEITSRSPHLLLRLKCSGTLPLLFAQTEGLLTASPSPRLNSAPIPRAEGAGAKQNHTRASLDPQQQGRKVAAETTGGDSPLHAHAMRHAPVNTGTASGLGVSKMIGTGGSGGTKNITTGIGREDTKYRAGGQVVLWTCNSWLGLRDVASQCGERKYAEREEAEKRLLQ